MRKGLEVEAIDRFVAGLPRSPLQVHGPHEADAELLDLGGGAGILALKAEAVVEEISAGLFTDPFEIGWVGVAAPLSDLAAVGAEPLGVLIQTTFDGSRDERFRAEVARGVRLACERARTFVLGGDTNSGPTTWIGAMAVGRIEGGALLTRIGARPGERLFASGPLGAGNVHAARRLLGVGPASPPPYTPEPRLALGRAIRGIASAAIDTSDGFISALDELARLNDVGAEIAGDPGAWLTAEAREVGRGLGTGPWPLLAGQHGEYELLFSVPESRLDRLRAAAGKAGASPIEIGRLVEEKAVTHLPAPGRRFALDTGEVRDLSRIEEVPRYIERLLALTAAWEGRR